MDCDVVWLKFEIIFTGGHQGRKKHPFGPPSAAEEIPSWRHRGGIWSLDWARESSTDPVKIEATYAV